MLNASLSSHLPPSFSLSVRLSVSLSYTQTAYVLLAWWWDFCAASYTLGTAIMWSVSWYEHRNLGLFFLFFFWGKLSISPHFICWINTLDFTYSYHPFFLCYILRLNFGGSGEWINCEKECMQKITICLLMFFNCLYLI